MSSDQPGKPPSQAGRFKPRKPATRKSSSVRAPSVTSSSVAGRAGRGDSERLDRGREGGRSRSRGRGKGRGRGRFDVPKGQVFFTGSAAASSTNPNNASGNQRVPSNESTNEILIKEEVVHMPGMGSSTNSRGGKGLSQVGKNAQERMLQSALARSGEGEELIVAEMEEGSGIGDGNKKVSALNSVPKDFDGPNLFANEGDDDKIELSVGEYTYDSDSSTDGDAKRASYVLSNRKKRDGRTNTPIQPQRLPFPPPRKLGSENVEILYKSQEQKPEKGEEKNTEIMVDPPLRSPFLNLKEATAEQKKEEQLSWMIFKLPTRLPRLAPHCTLSGKAMKNESAMETDATDASDLAYAGVDPSDPPIPDVVVSSTTPNSNTPVDSSATGYDDTLKDAAAGRYGKIVMHKSGKAYLIVGGADSKTPQVRMLLSEGLPCGFLQQAVAIDTSQATYVPLGEVQKSLVVTPDVESAFKRQ